MKKRRMKRKSCRAKVSHETKSDAEYAIKRTLKNNFIFHRLEAYYCKFCGKWHIGRTKKIVYSRFDKLNNSNRK